MSKFENPTKLLPMFVTDKLAETKAFYVDKLGWTATYDMPGYLQVRIDDREGPELSFMQPEGQAARYEGGAVVSVPVPDADRHHAAMVERGLKPVDPLSLKPWGWRSYRVSDPNGVVLDFFHVAAAGPAPQN